MYHAKFIRLFVLNSLYFVILEFLIWQGVMYEFDEGISRICDAR